MCFNSNTVECHFDLPLGLYVICVNCTLKHLTRVPLCTDKRRASLIPRTAAKLGTVYIFLNTKFHLTFFPYLDMIVWSQVCLLNYFSLRVTSLHMLANTNYLVNIIDYSAIHLHGYQRLFQNLKCALIAILSNASLKHRAL